MTKTRTLFRSHAWLIVACALFTFLTQCSDEEITPVYRGNGQAGAGSADSSVIDDCKKCTYVVPAGVKVIDGKLLRLKPGSVIGLSSAVVYGSLEFHNIVGSPQRPIIIRNCGGTARIQGDDPWHAIKTEHSKYFRITGGTTGGVYGIKVQGSEMGLKLDGLSTNFEVDHVEVSNVGFAGVMAKTDPTCNDSTIRGNFTMYDVWLHDNFIHDTGGEGFYIGNSFWAGMDRGCGSRPPHEIRNLKIYNNRVENTGWEAIQVGCAIKGTEIYNNKIKNYGTANIKYQNNGLQIGAGTGGLVYNNLIRKGTGNGMIIMGTGDNIIHNNIIVNAGENGIFCDERYTPGDGFKFINNTILSPRQDGIRIFAELVPMNMIINNIIANPGTFTSYNSDTTRTYKDSFIYLESGEVKANISNNLFVRSVDQVKFINPARENYRLQPNSPAIDDGKDISRLRIRQDFYKSTRLRGFAYDIGATEFNEL